MMYKGFANVYDHMMENIPYEEWCSKLKLYLKEHGLAEGRILSLIHI